MKSKTLCAMLALLISLSACSAPTEPTEPSKPDNLPNSQEPTVPSELDKPDETEPVTADLAAVREEMLALTPEGEALPLETARLGKLYGIEEAWVKQSASFTVPSGESAFPDLVIMTEAVDEDAASKIADKLQAKLDEITEQARDYEPESLAVAEKCKVSQNGLFVTLIYSADRDAFLKVYTQYVY